MKNSSGDLKDNNFTGLGINVIIRNFDSERIQKYVNCLKDLGTKWVRLEIDFNGYLASHKRYLNSLKQVVKQIDDIGISIVGLLYGSTPGTISSVFIPQYNYKPIIKRLSVYKKFVIDSVNTLKKHIRYWEIWNEPNLKRFWVKNPDPQEYYILLKEIFPQIRKIQSNSKILIGGISGDDKHNLLYVPRNVLYYKDYYRNLIMLGAEKYFDIASFHPYFLGCYFTLRKPEYILDKSISLIEGLKDRISKTSPEKPLWITEFGISGMSNFRMDNTKQSDMYTRLLQYCNNNNIPLALWCLYDESNENLGVLNPESGFSLLDKNLEPTKLYVKLKEYLSTNNI